MVKVTYYCGLKNFYEFVCPEHDNYAGKKARDWWRMRSTAPVPEKVDDMLELLGTGAAAVATHLEVWTNTKYPEITKHCFDGSNFGTQAASDAVNLVAPEASTTTHRVASANNGDLHPLTPTEAAARLGAQLSVQLQKAIQSEIGDDIPF